MTTYTTLAGERIEAETYFRCTATLGMNLVRTEDGRIFDIEPGDGFVIELHDANLDEIEGNIVSWMDDPCVKSADDFTGETAEDWNYVRTSV